MGNGHPVAAVICTEAVDASFAKSGVCYFNTVRGPALRNTGSCGGNGGGDCRRGQAGST